MKQKTCIVNDIYDAVKFLDDIKVSADYKKAKSIIVNIFTERGDKDYIEYFLNSTRKRIDKAHITGLTCMRGFGQGEFFHAATVFTVLFFFKSEVEVLEYDFSKITKDDAKNDFCSKLTEAKNLKGIQVFTPLANITEANEFFTAANAKYSDIPIFGAEAGYKATSKTKDIFIFGNSIIKDGLIIALFKGKNLKIFAESTLGWTPIGKEMKVTGVTSGRILKTIDNSSAEDIYKKYLGVTSSENFIENTCEFPFMLRRGNRWLARIPVAKDKDGYIHFTSDIKKGEKLLYSYGSKRVILQQAFKLAEYMSQKNLEGLLLHVCNNRFVYLKDDETLELQAFSSFYRETAGCFAFSEILFKNSSGGLQNSALLAVGFQEISDASTCTVADDCFLEDVSYGNNSSFDYMQGAHNFSINKNSATVPFEERLVNFLHATTRDLYLANVQLEDAATIDGLTGIFNRKKITERINYEMAKRHKEKRITVIMFDIDNFKHVNDTYGHDMGDEVLVKVSQTARNNIRKQDSIGRWGGEEFMILLPETTKEEAVTVAEKIRVDINNLKWEKMNAISISLGVAEVRPKDDIQTLYKRVDNRLYYAKTHGKNQVVSEDL